MWNDQEEITLKDKDGNPIVLTVDVPPEPQPQMILESFSHHELYSRDNEPNDEDE